MSVLLFIISLIVGLVVTAVINRLMALFYCFLLVVFGIWLLIFYWESLFPFIQFLLFLVGFILGICLVVILMYISILLIAVGITHLKNYLTKNKNDDR